MFLRCALHYLRICLATSTWCNAMLSAVTLKVTSIVTQHNASSITEAAKLMLWQLGGIRTHPVGNYQQISFCTFYRFEYCFIYGIQLWGTASTSNIEILERFQSKALRMIVDAPWYVTNTVTRKDLQIPTVKEEIRRYSSQYSTRLSAHTNDLIVNLIELPDNRRLRRHLPNDLSTRFLV
jgi:hypothetical protein